METAADLVRKADAFRKDSEGITRGAPTLGRAGVALVRWRATDTGIPVTSHSMRCVSTVRAALAATAVLLTAGNAQSTAIYRYTGNFFDQIVDDTSPDGTFTTRMRVTGHFEVASPFGPHAGGMLDEALLTDFSFSDGRSALTLANSTILNFIVLTGPQGEIAGWNIDLQSESPLSLPGQRAATIGTGSNLPPVPGSEDLGALTECLALPCSDPGNTASDAAFIQELPGTWTLIPEPSTALLFAAGLVGLGLRRRPH